MITRKKMNIWKKAMTKMMTMMWILQTCHLTTKSALPLKKLVGLKEIEQENLEV